jgi:hypothetical protein
MPASGILTSRPVRTAIVNRAIGDHPAFFDPMQLPPILSQAAGQEEIETLPYPGMPVPVEAEPGGAIAPAEAAPMPPEPPAPVDVVPDFLQQGSLEPNPLALRRGIPLNTRRFIG